MSEELNKDIRGFFIKIGEDIKTAFDECCPCICLNRGRVHALELSDIENQITEDMNSIDKSPSVVIPINKDIGLIMISYTDDIFADFWYSSFKNGDIGRQLYKYLKEIFPDRQIPMRPAITRVHYWGSGGHFFTPGSNSEKVINDIVKPFNSKELYIIGESYSSHQSWIEGALETSDLAINKILY